MDTPPTSPGVALHVNAVADRLDLLPYEVRELIDAGSLPAEVVEERTYVPADALARYIEGQAS